MLLRAVVRLVLRLVWRLEVDGEQRLPRGPMIVVANHDSLADVFVLGAAISRPLRFFAKEELWSNRIVGWAMDLLGGIRVARARGDLGAVGAAAAVLADGDAVAIFPQGTTLGPPDRPWQRGAARLALTTGAPLFPVALVGARDALPPGSRLPRRARIRVVVGEPIAVPRQAPTIPETRALTERIRDVVRSLA